MFAWIQEFAAWLLTVFKTALLTLLDLLKDAFLWVVDQCLQLIVYLVGLIDFGALNSYSCAGYIGQLGSDIINVLGLVRVPEGMAIIVSAIVVRVVLQLIPFTRLGS